MKHPTKLSNRHPRDYLRAVDEHPLRSRALRVSDSWGLYDAVFPLSIVQLFTGGSSNVFMALQELVPMVSLNLPQNGARLHQMLSNQGLEKIGEWLDKYGPFTYLFFSGGGNDIVQWLPRVVYPKGYEQGPLKTYVLESHLYSMKLRLEKLGELRDRVSPRTQILTHNYGLPNLSKGGFRRLGITFAGPWIMPKLAAKGYGIDESEAIIADVLHRFYRMQRQALGPASVVDTASELRPEYWRDEMHLTPAGYKAAAAAFVPHLRQGGTEWH